MTSEAHSNSPRLVSMLKPSRTDVDAALLRDPHSGVGAFLAKHRQNFARRPVTEKLPRLLLVPADAISLDELQETLRFVAGERRLRKRWILRDEVFRLSMNVSEVAPAAARDPNFFADAGIVLEHEHRPSPLSGLDRAHQACRPGADDDHIWLHL